MGLPGLYAAYVLIGALSAGSNTVAYARLLTGWFSRSRGLALGIGMSGIPIGMAITSPLAQFLIEHSGWQSAFLGLAALPILVGLPVALFALHEAPKAAEPQPSRFNVVPAPGATRQQAMQGRGFWTLLVVFLLLATAMNGIELHIVPLLSDRGFPPMVAALALSLLNIVAIAARVGAGYLFDRTFAPRVAAFLFLLPLVATLLLLGTQAPLAAYGAAVLLGFGVGAESDLLGYLIARYFGVRAYGELFGWIFGAFMCGTAAGPYLFGLGYDAHGNYALPLTCAAAALAVVSVLLRSMPPYPDIPGPERA
jgi:predicted MFS family arabinose efflux permease